MTGSGRIANICVYCGSSPGHDESLMRAAEHFGRILAENGIGLVYGGGNLGLMGAVARSALDAGGRVTGIIPGFLAKREHMLEAVQDLLVVEDMHSRKRLMFENADAFVAFPGGIGTLEELVEQLTWVQLGRHDKPVLIADLSGFWAPLLALLDHMRETGFIRRDYEARYLIADRVEDILPALRAAYAVNARPRRSLPQEF
ncbi:Rossman fold protein, TIGR00730 family [Rhodoblastus sphagnicola]|uniref:Cytokinin riboside 5'-monophosphate phosphoribohydrolase n=1 Tax=Rhodoblastus sphagnicola TaxID=333368 RepID=A0A2S6MYH0_9HYPH|nr:TIGR00730 family Rossman fold protein [Rhodoblastus sphagnicola]MBB4199421.1 hypothetical protein [Rhodoblastus sphagnicola]PPQ27407.1 Rossman fold protein, TIGR00730 family [Rhodoblastus sphagnicola]